jgi:succinoglycan biosynthesis protein ExoA
MSTRLNESSSSIGKKSSQIASSISVVIPSYNEERYIKDVLVNLADQYDREYYEMIIVDGMSEDRTREVIAEFCRERPAIRITILDNPTRKIPTALNLGISAASGEIIARMDAHAVASPGYIRRCAEVLQSTGAGVVGMPCVVCAGDDTLIAKAIALGVSNKFGIGDAKYRLLENKVLQEAVDTVAFGFFPKSVWEEIGGFNEDLSTNEDYDFNFRVRQLGKVVLLDRTEHCDYFARSTLRELIKQYRRYGSWKARMVLLNPKSIKLRHLVAPLFVCSTIALALFGSFFRPMLLLLLVEILCYFLLSLMFAFRIARHDGGGMRLFLLMPIVFFTIHWSWGTGFLVGLFRTPR